MQLSSTPPSEIYQLKVALVGISPMIWRRLLVHSDSSIADLHHFIQIAVGWEDIHLHRFIIHAQEYGIYRSGGIWFDSNAHQVKLHHFGFRRNEKFRYHYDFGDDWQHEIRVEAILPVEDKKVYPMCIAGKRAAPPEDCGGVEGYVEQQQAAPLETIELFRELVSNEMELRAGDHEALQELLPWLNLEHFDRRAVNRRLHLYAEGNQAWLFVE